MTKTVRGNVGFLALAGALVLMPVLTSCAPTPPDQITEIEDIENGLSVETNDGKEYAFRDGLPCGTGDRLWGDDGRDGTQGCADGNDLLGERQGARKGDPEDRAHQGEESDETDE